ncbi:MAG: alcohol dehydrogenase [Microbacteriaceae bacterium]|nr:alcohol dehydrogenase [Microbacteriaceae bacterium]
MKMQAAVLRETGRTRPFAVSRALEIEEVDLEGPGPGQVLVRVASAGLCHSDLSAISGNRPRALPAVAGHEGAGVVVEMGEGVRDLAVGDKVVMVFVNSCGTCEFCAVGRPNLCQSSWTARAEGSLSDGSRKLAVGGKPLHHWSGISSFAEYAVVSRSSLIRIDADIPLLDAAVLGCAVITGVGSVLNTAQVRAGDSVAVTGLGGVGLSAVMGAAVAGASMIVAIDTVPAKLELALELGATHAINGREADAIDQVRDLTRGGVQHSFEMAGVPAATTSAYAMVRRGGQLVIASLPHPDAVLEIPLASHVGEEKRIVGAYMGSSVATRDIPRYAELYRQGRLPINRLRSAVLPLNDINMGFDRLADGKAVRDVIGFTSALAEETINA